MHVKQSKMLESLDSLTIRGHDQGTQAGPTLDLQEASTSSYLDQVNYRNLESRFDDDSMSQKERGFYETVS